MGSTIESIDSFKMINSLNTLRPLMADSEVKTSLRLLAIFGENGSSIIYVTADDRAFGYGNNRYGCLGLALKETTKHVSSPTLIPALSGRQLANVFTGFGHCIGLTAGGQCLSWGENDFGQCGVGTLDATQTPQLITNLTDKHVMTAACGNRHSVALTDNGHAYGWGRNSFGQIGDNTTNYILCPIRVAITSPIATISCGKCHSLAVTSDGVLYVWGFNEFGQLGRHRDRDQREYKERAFSKSPITVIEFADKVIAKAVCGPNHTLALTSDGTLYAFGLNDVGQVGNGTCNTQWTPAAIPRLKFKDIVATYDSHISLGVANDGKYYVWGLKYSFKFYLRPHTSELQTGFNLLDVYYRYSGNYKTFKTIIFDGVKPETETIHSSTSSKSGITLNGNQPNGTSNTVQSRSSSISSSSMISLPDKSIDMTDMPSVQSLPQTVGTPLDTTETSIINELVKHFGKAFDNHLDCDLKFVFKDKRIHCHKRLLQIRNEKFWRFCSKYLTSKPQNTDEIHVKSHSFETIYAFIQCLYGLKPKITDYKMAGEVLILSTTCDERQLKDLCAEYLRQNELDLNSAPLLTQRNETREEMMNTSAQELVTYWKRSFNNRETSDFKFIIDDRIIYCHKTLLEVRCPALWNRIRSVINEDTIEIPIKGHPFEEFRAFIGHLYGIEPKISPELQKIAQLYGQNIEVFAGSGDHSTRSKSIVNGRADDCCLAPNSSATCLTGDGIVSEAMFASTLFTPLFNNENNFDIKFKFNEKHIFAHKFILSKRNSKFWSEYEQRLGFNGVIDMTDAPFSLDSMHAFIGYLYGMAPHVNDQTFPSLLKLAKTSGETVLKELCRQFWDRQMQIQSAYPLNSSLTTV